MKLELTPAECKALASRRARAVVRPVRSAEAQEIFLIDGREFEIVSVSKHRLGFCKTSLFADLGHDDGEGFALHWKKRYPGKWSTDSDVYVHRLREIGAPTQTYSRQIPKAQRTLEVSE